MPANGKELSIGYGKVREISIDSQSYLLGILRLSDWMLVFGCVFLLTEIFVELFVVSGSKPRSEYSVPSNLVVQTLIVVPFLCICAYTGWKHIGVINPRIWEAHLIIFGILVLYLTLTIVLGLQNDFPTWEKE